MPGMLGKGRAQPHGRAKSFINPILGRIGDKPMKETTAVTLTFDPIEKYAVFLYKIDADKFAQDNPAWLTNWILL